AVVAVWLMTAALAKADERDLQYAIAYLRAGAQTQAEQSLAKYRDEQGDADVRRTVDRVILLLNRPLPDDVREYIAVTLEETLIRPTPVKHSRPAYFSRMFPVFP